MDRFVMARIHDPIKGTLSIWVTRESVPEGFSFHHHGEPIRLICVVACRVGGVSRLLENFLRGLSMSKFFIHREPPLAGTPNVTDN
jgi:hypothetical protein